MLKKRTVNNLSTPAAQGPANGLYISFKYPFTFHTVKRETFVFNAFMGMENLTSVERSIQPCNNFNKLRLHTACHIYAPNKCVQK